MNDAHDAEPEQSPYVRLPWALVAAGLVGVLVVALGLGLFANRYLRPQVEVLPTPIAIAAAQTNTPVPIAAPAPLATPTAPPLVQATVVRPPELPAMLSPTSRPTIDPVVAEEVSQAYEHYWQIRAEALLNLDKSKLEEVMDGPHLKSVQDLISELDSEQRAIETNIDHSYTVLEVSADAAQVIDTYVSNSVYVNLTTHEALTQPTSDRLRELYRLRLVDGTWKVVSLANAP